MKMFLNKYWKLVLVVFSIILLVSSCAGKSAERAVVKSSKAFVQESLIPEVKSSVKAKIVYADSPYYLVIVRVKAPKLPMKEFSYVDKVLYNGRDNILHGVLTNYNAYNYHYNVQALVDIYMP